MTLIWRKGILTELPLCYGTVYRYNNAQRCDQFSQNDRSTGSGFDLAWFSSLSYERLSSVFSLLFTLIFFVVFFTLRFSEWIGPLACYNHCPSAQLKVYLPITENIEKSWPAWKLNCSRVLTTDTAPVKRLYCCVTHYHLPAAFCCGRNLEVYRL